MFVRLELVFFLMFLKFIFSLRIRIEYDEKVVVGMRMWGLWCELFGVL